MVNKKEFENIKKDVLKLQKLFSNLRHQVHINIWNWVLYQDWKNYFILKYDWIELRMYSTWLEINIINSLDILNKSKKLIEHFFDSSREIKELQEK